MLSMKMFLLSKEFSMIKVRHNLRCFNLSIFIPPFYILMILVRNDLLSPLIVTYIHQLANTHEGACYISISVEILNSVFCSITLSHLTFEVASNYPT